MIRKCLDKAFSISWIILGIYFTLGLTVIIFQLNNLLLLLAILGLLIVFLVSLIGITKFVFWLLFRNPNTENNGSVSF
jgi:hypothetical protein